MTRSCYDHTLVVTSVLSGFLFLLFLEISVLKLTGGSFDYPLDDVYIHLAMAEGIGRGMYGVNPGEYSSAASSVLYPFLLLPVLPPEYQRLLPILWNVVGLTLMAFFWAKILIEGGYSSARLHLVGLGLAIGGPIALLMSSTAFLGMEHTLHAAASLVILLGIIRHLKGQPSWLLLYLGIFFSPLLRYEGLALSVLACLVLLFTRQYKQAFFGLALAILPLVIFSGFLTTLGLDPLPNSIQAKQLIAVGADLNILQERIAIFRNNISTVGGAILLGFIIAVWSVLALNREVRSGPFNIFALVLILAGVGHLFFGQIGWLNRYEQYILVSLVAGFVFLIGGVAATINRAIVAFLASISILIPAILYLPEVVVSFPVNSRAIHTQQGQMSTFAKKFLKAPVAVNDIGWVAWNNPNYVLDLWGLASTEALALRLSENDMQWAGPLAKSKSVKVAMIYSTWFEDAVSSNWIRLGEFRLKELRGFLGSDVVTFYATAPEYVSEALQALESWVPELDPLTFFVYADEIK